MKQEAFTNFSDQYLTSAGLLIFFIFFISVVIWVFRKGSTEYYSQIDKLPLTDGEKI